MGMSDHTNPVMLKDEWLTPPYIIKALGEFDLDPCSPIVKPWNTAKHHYTINDDGLERPWTGRVWCNPPYGLEATKWLAKLAEHKSGTALIFARTETRMFFSEVWSKANAVLFLKGRIHFHHVCGTRAKANSGAPSVLIAYGEHDVEMLRICRLPGKFIKLNNDLETNFF
jgi:hypothetical protein